MGLLLSGYHIRYTTRYSIYELILTLGQNSIYDKEEQEFKLELFCAHGFVQVKYLSFDKVSYFSKIFKQAEHIGFHASFQLKLDF